jgi:uncharacterized pyridoxamine 5'-phosphate oxidase family protein
MAVISKIAFEFVMFEFAIENARLAFDEHQEALNMLNTYICLENMYKERHTNTFYYYQFCIDYYANKIAELREIEAEKRRESMEWQTMCVGLSV